ncbi:hypothetical protein D4100_04025 [Serratia inhibens]|uniref:Uncharacterized protein n=2 Tax=Serratia inhibens TaxID=2338073 RepID=A0AA93BXF1_9GAMM|nr:hypothetical protein D4100_04025 [Serratia inhibens]
MSFAPERPPVANWPPREVKVSQTLNLKYWLPNLNIKHQDGATGVKFSKKRIPHGEAGSIQFIILDDKIRFEVRRKRAN